MLAASAGAPIAEPAPTSVCASSTNRIRFGCSLISLITAWTRSSNIPRSMVPATTAFICRLTMWQSRSRPGTVSGSISMRRASPSTMAVLPTPGSPISITEFDRSRWHRISSTCWISSIAADHGRDLVLARQQVQVHGKVLERRPAARTACAAAPRAARCRGSAWRHAPPARPARRRGGGRSSPALPGSGPGCRPPGPPTRWPGGLPGWRGGTRTAARASRRSMRAARQVSPRQAAEPGRSPRSPSAPREGSGPDRASTPRTCPTPRGRRPETGARCVNSACPRRRASSTARSTTRWADSPIRLCAMSRSSMLVPSGPPLDGGA